MTAAVAAGARALRELCHRVAGTEYGEVPVVVRDDAKRSLLDLLASCAAGSDAELWQDDPGNREQSAFSNALRSHGRDFDPVHGRSHGHPAAMLWPALMPFYISGECSGVDLVTAYASGHEAMCVLGDLLGRQLRETRKHPTCLLGAVAVALAVGRARGLPPQSLLTGAFLAAVTSTGHSAGFGSAAKAYQLAAATRGGLSAALAAGTSGYGAGDAARAQALWTVLSDAVAPLEPADPGAVRAFAAPWRIEAQPTFHKLVPICGYLITTVVGFERQYAELGLPVSEVESIAVGVPRSVAVVVRAGSPSTEDEARFALGFLLAVAAAHPLDGFDAGLHEFAREQDVGRLTAVTAVTHDLESEQDGLVRVELRLRSGGRRTLLIPVQGAAEQFEPEEIVVAKWRRYLEPRVPPELARRLASTTRSLEKAAGPEWFGLASAAGAALSQGSRQDAQYQHV